MEISAGGFIARHQDPTYRSVGYSIVKLQGEFLLTCIGEDVGVLIPLNQLICQKFVKCS